MEAAILLQDKELLKHRVEQSDALRELDLVWLASKQLNRSNIGVDRHLFFVFVQEHLDCDLVFFEVQRNETLLHFFVTVASDVAELAVFFVYDVVEVGANELHTTVKEQAFVLQAAPLSVLSVDHLVGRQASEGLLLEVLKTLDFRFISRVTGMLLE